MIGCLKGTVIHKKPESLILLVGGVGYLVHAAPSWLSQMRLNTESLLYIHTHVREDNISLYGFNLLAELELFELLLSVSGIGPKTALAIVDRGVDKIRQAIASADVAFFTTIPRLGTKNAQKVIIELKSKLGSTYELDLQNTDSGETQELMTALVGMGFSKAEVVTALRKLPVTAVKLSDKVRQALKILGQTKL